MHAELEHLGENACLVTLGKHMDITLNRRVHALASRLEKADITGTQDMIPGFASLLLRHALTDAADIEQWHKQVRAIVEQLPEDASASDGVLHDIPVHYDGEDLEHVARHCGLSADDVVHRHTAPVYRVAMIGFAPGFPYLIGMDPSLATPRRASPRIRVPAGAVAIGGEQTGIYPRTLPGGWQLIGRTSTRLFDPANENRPCLMEPGDSVRFHALEAPAAQHAGEDHDAAH